jgi:hypothetical protein
MIGNIKYKSLDRLKNALVTNASLNQIDAFKENYSYWKSIQDKGSSQFGLSESNKELLMYFAMKSISRDVVEFLIKENVKCNYSSCIYGCKFTQIKEVYEFINEMINKHGLLTDNKTHLHKDMIIRRLIEPDKVNVNKERIILTIDLIRSGFLDSKEVRDISEELYNNIKYKGMFTMMSRELLLTELGI